MERGHEMTATTAETAQFDMGRVLQRTFQVTGRDFGPLFLIALVPIGTMVVVGLIIGILLAATGFHPDQGGILAYIPQFIVAGLVIVVLAVATAAFAQSALTYRTIGDLNGARASLNEAFTVAGRVWLPVVGVALLATVAFLAAFMLFIVPAIFLACVWTVIIPVQVIERRGVFQAFERSAELTRGSRWRILLLLLVVLVAYVVTRLLLVGLTAALGLIGSFATLLVSVVVTLIGAVLTTCIYYELRSIKEGVAPQALAQVFS